MIHARLVQTHVGYTPCYTVDWPGAPAMRVVCTRMAAPFTLELLENEGVAYRLVKDMRSDLMHMFDFRRHRRADFYLVRDASGNQVGALRREIQGGLLPFIFHSMTLHGREYQMYEVGLGAEGIKLPIHSGEAQIALIEKPPTVRDNKDEYELCALDAQSMTAALLLCLMQDAANFANRGEFAANSTSVTHVFTKNQRLIEKYDPNFKQLQAESRGDCQ